MPDSGFLFFRERRKPRPFQPVVLRRAVAVQRRLSGLRGNLGLHGGRRLSSAGGATDRRRQNAIHRFLLPADAVERLLERRVDAHAGLGLAGGPPFWGGLSPSAGRCWWGVFF